MKKITFFIATVLALGVIISSCEKKEADPVFDPGKTVAPSFSEPADGQAFVLVEDSAGSVLTTFNWSPATYDPNNLGDPIYAVHMDIADSNFTNPVEIANTSETSFDITVGAMNSHLLSLGLEPDVEGTVAFRIMSLLNSNASVSTVYSGSISMTLTPYSGDVEVPKLWVPGDYQGWDPASAPNVFDFDGDGVYTGYVYFPEDAPSFEFKFTSEPSWDGTNYGAGAEEGTLDTDGGAGNLEVPGPGGWHFEVDVNNLTWGVTNENQEPENWGVIGEWLAWEEDIDMIYDPVNQELYVTVENIPAADNQRFKFRANDGWDINLGAKDPDDGFLVPGGADIPIPDGGTITFYLRFTTPEPSYEIEYN